MDKFKGQVQTFTPGTQKFIFSLLAEGRPCVRPENVISIRESTTGRDAPWTLFIEFIDVDEVTKTVQYGYGPISTKKK